MPRLHLLLALVAILVGLAGGVRSQPRPSGGRPEQVLLRLEGTMQAERKRGAVGFTVVSLGLLGSRPATRFLAVEEARTIGGDPGVLGKDVLDAVRPFEPDLLVGGPTALMERLYGAAVGDRITLEGLVKVSSRRYFLREALVISPETTTTTVPTSTTLPLP